MTPASRLGALATQIKVEIDVGFDNAFEIWVQWPMKKPAAAGIQNVAEKWKWYDISLWENELTPKNLTTPTSFKDILTRYHGLWAQEGKKPNIPTNGRI